MISNDDAMTAMKRFGLGATPGLKQAIAADPRSYVVAQLDNPKAALLPPGQVSARDGFLIHLELVQAGKAGASIAVRDEIKKRRRQMWFSEERGRMKATLASRTPLLERLAQFWVNHFAISARKGRIRELAGDYERTAIRPHVLGRFTDMLHAAIQHPAMIMFLDNHLSLGPNSIAAQRSRRGLNENLAREIMELHTLGVDGGYSQEDVTEFAKVLTGWRFVNPAQQPEAAGAFMFYDEWHEPGPKTIMGKTYRENGPYEGDEVLHDLARHPSTARFIATKLVRHFVADDPPAALVDKLARVFLETDGDLAAVTTALVTADAAWSEPAGKFLPPFDFVIAAARAFPGTLPPAKLLRHAFLMGQRLWAPASPQGYSDMTEDWLSPGGLEYRMAFANEFAHKARIDGGMPEHMASLYGDALSEDTQRALSRAETAQQATVLFLMSADFQRR